ncbi:MAG: ABC transporter ATP-binding protein [Rhodospirillales bacterium]
MSARLATENVSHAFGQRPVIDRVSLAVEQGEIACLLGPSGCGKTTLLRIVAGLERLQAGKVTIGDRVVADPGTIDLPPESRSVGLMFQDYALFPHLTVIENVSFGIQSPDAETRRRLDVRLELMGLAAYRDRYPHELSGGQQQRVALLRATAPNPTVLLLDEPFTGLDTTLRTQVRDQALEYLAAQGQTALMVTHDPEEAMYMANRLFVMDRGVIAQSGSPIDVYTRPVSPFVAGLFGPLNAIPVRNRSDGAVDTPFGPVPLKGDPSPGRLSLLVRPEHVRVLDENTGAGTPMSVVWCRSIGRSTQVRLALETDPSSTLMARVDGAFAGVNGQPVRVVIDPGDVLVFTDKDG